MFLLRANTQVASVMHLSGGGHEAMSCDLLPTDTPGPHYQGDVFDVINDGWDLMIAHPPCTYLTIAAEWAYKDPSQINKKLDPEKLYGKERIAAREEAIEFVMALADAPIERIAIENPIGVLSSRWREPDQFIQPYEYGEDASKKTCLWLKCLPKLQPTELCVPRLAPTKDGRGFAFRWGNQTDSGQNVEPPGKDRWKVRSTTWQGWADAMAQQWGGTAWVPCECCGEYLCTIHDCHAHECNCPEIDYWEVDPYQPGSRIYGDAA